MPTNYYLIAGGALSAIIALAHLGCIFSACAKPGPSSSVC